MTPNIAASVQARLLNRAKVAQEEFELFLTRFAAERFLYRLGASRVRDEFVLKGAAMLAIWMPQPHRATRDVDLLARGTPSDERIHEVLRIVCAVPCAEDGLRFDVDSLAVEPIRSETEYVGQRARMMAYLGTARIRVQIDFGFGDAVTPPPEEATYPTILEALPAPKLFVYPPVATIAEKFEAMVTLGDRNSRMKDFHDLSALPRALSVRGETLQAAIVACFARRGVSIVGQGVDPLAVAFYQRQELNARWQAYRRANDGADLPEGFEEIGNQIRAFLLPVRDAIAANNTFASSWKPGGPWKGDVRDRA